MNLRALFGLFALFFMGLACSHAYQKAELDPSLKSAIDASNKGKVPLERFFETDTYGQPHLSPDGKHLAVIFKKEGVNHLAVLDKDMSKAEYVAKFATDQSVTSVTWVNDTRLLLTVGFVYGYLDGRVRNERPYFVDYDGKNLRDFFVKESASYELVRTLPKDPEHIVMARYDWRERGRPTAVLVNVNTGHVNTIASPYLENGTFLADEDGNVDVAVEADEKLIDVTHIYYRPHHKAKWEKLDYPARSPNGAIRPIALDEGKHVLYVASSHETGRFAIYKFDLETKKKAVVSSDPKVDDSGVIMEDGRLVGVQYDPDYNEKEILDPRSLRMQLYGDLTRSFPNSRIDSLNLTRDKSQGIFRVDSDMDPGQYYSIEVASKKIRKIGESRVQLDRQLLSPMKPVTYKARDGLEISGYLTIPKSTKGKMMPTVILPHGGPHGVRDYWGYDSEVQFLASRGYAVFQINYRGSGGYGYEFQRAGYRQWGRSMQDDLTDGTKWLIKEGYADPKRICIYGASYGGYAALMGVVREPDLYRCAVSYVGVTDLTIQRSSSDTSNFDAGHDYLDKALGVDEKDLKARSPVYNVEKIKVPIFLAAGKDDVRVPFANAEKMEEALRKAGKPVETLYKGSEGHGFQQDPNRFEFYYRLERFLEANIGK